MSYRTTRAFERPSIGIELRVLARHIPDEYEARRIIPFTLAKDIIEILHRAANALGAVRSP